MAAGCTSWSPEGACEHLPGTRLRLWIDAQAPIEAPMQDAQLAVTSTPSGRKQRLTVDVPEQATMLEFWAQDRRAARGASSTTMSATRTRTQRRVVGGTSGRHAPRTAEGTGRLMWFTFSSMRAYGLHPPGRNGNDQPGQLIWMAAVDPEAILRGEDGSFAPFALPFQDITTSNHIAQWTAQVVPVDPDPNNPGDCPDIGDICDPAGPACCGAATCSANGNGV